MTPTYAYFVRLMAIDPVTREWLTALAERYDALLFVEWRNASWWAMLLPRSAVR